MRLRRLLPFVLLACALVAPATARAHEGPQAPAAALHAHYAQAAPAATTTDPAADPLIGQYLQLAQAHWAASPNCPDGISLQRAEWLPDPGVWAAAVQGGCAIAFDPDFYPAPAEYDYGWWQAAMCSVVAHEWGHLLGYGHVSDPNSLMNPVTPLNIVGGCPTWGIPGAAEESAPAETAPAPSKARKATKRSTCASRAHSARRRAKSRRSCAAPAKRRSHH